MPVCPSCLSLESAAWCARCGARADVPQGPLFWCTLGWSRSRDYEAILRSFKAEDGYRCVETAEEILHQVPLSDIAAMESFIRRFPRAMLWKETRLETPGGIAFSLHGPVGACFLRRVLDRAAPCLQEAPSCPFLGDMQFPESGAAGAAQLAAFLALHPDAHACPYARSLIDAAFSRYCPAQLAPFAAARARLALESGRIVMTQEGDFTPRVPGADPWPTRPCPDIPAEATWAAASGHLQLAVVDDQLRLYPSGRKLAPWLSAAMVAPTRDGRHAAVPAPQSADAHFLVFDEQAGVLACGPFPLPFALDSRMRHAAFTSGSAGKTRRVVLAAYVGGVAEPFWLQTGAWELPEPARLLACERGVVGVLSDSDQVFRLDAGGTTARRHFPQCLQIAILDDGQMAVLWQDGWRLTFWNETSMRDFSLLVPARRIIPSRDAHLVLVSAGRITEIGPDGTVADFRCAEALWMSRRGYMEKTPDGYLWHVLDDVPLHGEFWQNAPGIVWVAEPAGNVRIRTEDPAFPLVAELISYFISGAREAGALGRLLENAPGHVRRELERLLKRHPWLRGFDGPAEEWPVSARPLEDHHFE